MARFAEFYASSMQGARAPRIGFPHYQELSTRLRAILPGERAQGMTGAQRHWRTPDEDCRLNTATITPYPGARPLPAVPKPAVPKPAVPILVGD